MEFSLNHTSLRKPHYENHTSLRKEGPRKHRDQGKSQDQIHGLLNIMTSHVASTYDQPQAPLTSMLCIRKHRVHIPEGKFPGDTLDTMLPQINMKTFVTIPDKAEPGGTLFVDFVVLHIPADKRPGETILCNHGGQEKKWDIEEHAVPGCVNAFIEKVDYVAPVAEPTDIGGPSKDVNQTEPSKQPKKRGRPKKKETTSQESSSKRRDSKKTTDSSNDPPKKRVSKQNIDSQPAQAQPARSKIDKVTSPAGYTMEDTAKTAKKTLTCDGCSIDIKKGDKYHPCSEENQDYDLCKDCYQAELEKLCGRSRRRMVQKEAVADAPVQEEVVDSHEEAVADAPVQEEVVDSHEEAVADAPVQEEVVDSHEEAVADATVQEEVTEPHEEAASADAPMQEQTSTDPPVQAVQQAAASSSQHHFQDDSEDEDDVPEQPMSKKATSKKPSKKRKGTSMLAISKVEPHLQATSKILQQVLEQQARITSFISKVKSGELPPTADPPEPLFQVRAPKTFVEAPRAVSETALKIMGQSDAIADEQGEAAFHCLVKNGTDLDGRRFPYDWRSVRGYGKNPLNVSPIHDILTACPDKWDKDAITHMWEYGYNPPLVYVPIIYKTGGNCDRLDAVFLHPDGTLTQRAYVSEWLMDDLYPGWRARNFFVEEYL